MPPFRLATVRSTPASSWSLRAARCPLAIVRVLCPFLILHLSTSPKIIQALCESSFSREESMPAHTIVS